MAYFETLGQLQSNDYTFREIYSFTGNPGNKVLPNAEALSIEIGDYIMMIGISGNGSINGSPSSTGSNIAIAGTTTIFAQTINSNIVSSNHTILASGNSNNWAIRSIGTLYVFIGKATQTSLTITGTYSGGGFKTNIYKLCPR